LESEDPTWQQILSCGPFVFANRFSEYKDNLEKLLANNPHTRNVLTLIELTTFVILSLNPRNVADHALNNEPFGGLGLLYFCIILMNHFIATLTVEQLKFQLFLPNDWPSFGVSTSSNGNYREAVAGSRLFGGKAAVESLWNALVGAAAYKLSNSTAQLAFTIYQFYARCRRRRCWMCASCVCCERVCTRCSIYRMATCSRTARLC